MSSDKEILYVVKIGGNVIDDESKLHALLEDFSSIAAKKMLVHGGGKLATKMAAQLNIPQQMVEGRRITDEETLKIVTMVYGGLVNKNIVAQLQRHGCNAIGLTGADGNIIKAHKRVSGSNGIDYGFAGDVDVVNHEFLKQMLEWQLTPVLAPLTHDQQGLLLNTNADTITKEVGTALQDSYHVELIYLFEKAGVLQDEHNDDSVISLITANSYQELKHKNIVSGGMIPKLDNAFAALNAGVSKVVIGKAEDLKQIIAGKKGTSIVHE